MASSVAVKSLADIPNLVELYSSLKLRPSPTEGDLVVAPSSAVNARVSLFCGDITKLRLDAIVNAANKTLMGGGGVDHVIHRAAGHALVDECRGLGGCPVGLAKITRGYDLPAANVIHTVGPVYDPTNPWKSEGSLRSCYKESLSLATKNELKTIAFPAISTGAYRFPSKDAARVACETVRRYLDNDYGLSRVVFVTYERKEVEAYNEMIPYFPSTLLRATGRCLASSADHDRE
ncbi:macro domain-containing protein [Drechmeria coniospora]|uniref:Macro domain-containing protein n=1 Tax=Drechmeria coniospora TaxID=98403 RepID=A0A151GXX0_DRECN|nr:macro domain-containing protein [Drechmeria coniospora]KYK61959.1 macro domain-containing protein [Drechmeria coniospora]